jgi:hypothetical protein
MFCDLAVYSTAIGKQIEIFPFLDTHAIDRSAIDGIETLTIRVGGREIETMTSEDFWKFAKRSIAAFRYPVLFGLVHDRAIDRLALAQYDSPHLDTHDEELYFSMWRSIFPYPLFSSPECQNYLDRAIEFVSPPQTIPRFTIPVSTDGQEIALNVLNTLIRPDVLTRDDGKSYTNAIADLLASLGARLPVRTAVRAVALGIDPIRTSLFRALSTAIDEDRYYIDENLVWSFEKRC